MFDDSVQLSKAAKVIYGAYLISCLILSLYWTVTGTGLAIPLVRLQTWVLFGYNFPILTVFLALVPIVLPGMFLIFSIDGFFRGK